MILNFEGGLFVTVRLPETQGSFKVKLNVLAR